jgi:hypothetical protein
MRGNFEWFKMKIHVPLKIMTELITPYKVGNF